ncbi:nucleotidyl transferase [candidate division GN15 bacterium]|uniref:Nucleotidyl transferase n=1 Tax=candidate division GN15 bacterium TaxID=2072418 RepID=A0A855X482_9BACT|nr:MAG: nucleotidyl transferase [candidate division GN15 bacterium]
MHFRACHSYSVCLPCRRTRRICRLRVIIPVAGYGSRLRPHTYSTNKSLIHVAGKPILSHVLEPVVPLQPKEVIFVIGFRGEEVQEYVERNYSFKSTFIRQTKLLGLGYAVSLALDAVPNEPALVLLGDTIVELDLRKFVAAGDSVLGLHEVADPHRFGIANVRDGHILGLEEKPTHPNGNLAVVGLYYFRQPAAIRRALDQLLESGRTTRGEIQFTDALQQLIESGERFVPYHIDSWHDCGKRETVLETNRYLLAKMPLPAPIEGSKIVPPVYVAPDARVTNCTLGPYTSISSGAIVQNSTIRNSIVSPDARIADAVLEDSLIGANALVSGCTGRLNIGDSSEVIIT